MSPEIKSIDTKDIWENFLQATRPNTFLHSWNWGEFNRQMGDKVFRLGLFDGEKLHGIALIIKITAKRGSFLFCPHGPIFDSQIDNQEAFKILIFNLRNIAKSENCSFVRLSPLMLDNFENKQVFKNLNFFEAPLHMHPELSWMLDIQPDEKELIQAMRKTTRYSIRKAENLGVEIEISHDLSSLKDFWEVYKATYERQHFIPFNQYYLETEFKNFAVDDQVRVFLGKYNGEVIAAAIVIYYNGSGYYHHGASNQKYSYIPASYLVQWRAIQEARRRGFNKYNFWGISPDDKPKHPWAGLSLFKKGFGGYAEAYVHAKDLPINNKYWLTYAIETIRKVKRRL